jgi:hypothetical protein
MRLDRIGWIAAGMVLAASLGAASEARAVPLAGTLNITGAVAFGSSTIDFLPAGGGTGAFAIDPFTQQGSFVPLGGTTGAIGDLDALLHPTGVPFNFPLWLTFAADPAISFTLQFLNVGVYGAVDCGAAPAAGQTCTPSPGSPFNMANVTASSSTVSFALAGQAVGSLGELTPFTGVFTSQFAGQSLQDVIATLVAGGSVQSSFSASFVLGEVPEPELLSSLALGGLIAAAARQRSASRIG